MPDLPSALDAALRARYGWSGVRTPVTQRRGLLARMNQLEKRHTQKGDRPGAAGRRAARAAGIPPDQWTRWKKGQRKPSAASLAKIEKTYKDTFTLPALRRSIKAKGVPDKVNVSAEVRWNGYYNQTAQRTIKFGPSGVPTAMRATIRAWAHDGPEAAALAFEHGLSTAHNVPDEPDYPQPGDIGPGVRFEGNQVEIEFP